MQHVLPKEAIASVSDIAPSAIIGNATLYQADCREVLRTLADNSIDSIVTDPPYALVSIVKRFGKPNSAPAKGNAAYQRASAGFMGKSWDTGEVAFSEDFWRECLRVLKSGGHVVAFSGTRTYHRMAVAIEDAGFEIRDQLGWLYGSGFPKSHDVSKGIDKIIKRLGMFGPFARHYAERRKQLGLTHNAICAAGGFFAEHNHGGASTNWEKGHNVPTRSQWNILQPLLGLSDEFLPLIERVEAQREKIGEKKSGDPVAWYSESKRGEGIVDVTLAGTAEASTWEGWGTALKPAWEPICLARKPLIGTVAENVLQHGTGAINIDGTRVPNGLVQQGRWPANVMHDGSDEVLSAFPQTTSGKPCGVKTGNNNNVYGQFAGGVPVTGFGDSGSAARFFYCAKASRKDRDEGLEHLQKKAGGMVSNTSGQHITRRDDDYKPEPRANTHPTVKPTDLMRWLCRLVTPKGGVILDPFMGSGSTGKAALLEGFKFIGCEREDEYMPIAQARIAAVIPANDNAPQADLFGQDA